MSAARASLSPELERHLAAQERFESLRHDTLLRAGKKLCDLAYANPWDGPPPAALAALRDALATERPLDLQYTPYGGTTLCRRHVAQHLSATHGARFQWKDVVMTPGAMAALNLVFRALPAGSEVVVVTPCWLDYPLYLANLGLRCRFVSVAPGSLRLDVDAIAAALGPDTSAVVLSQPANPTGLLATREELEALATAMRAAPRRAADAPVLLVADECHRDLVFPTARDARGAMGDAFVSPATAYDDTVVIYSFGKKLFMQGQRIGYVAVSPRMADGRSFALTLERLTRVMGFCTPTAHMQLAVPALLDVKPDVARLAARSRKIASVLQDAGYDVAAPDATFFLYPRVPHGDDERFAVQLARDGVLVMPAAMFHHAGHVRLSVTATDAMIDAALPVLTAAARERAA